jgi:pre-60S factor REI1
MAVSNHDFLVAEVAYRINSVYNIKRRMASLPPISAQQYAEQEVIAASGSKDTDAVEASERNEIFETLDDRDIGGSSSDSDEAIIRRCLFCKMHCTTLESNLEHMSSEHSLFIPEPEHLCSVESFVQHLYNVINHFYECLYCGIIKHSAESVRHHMLSSGHCMINLVKEPELLEFWDFSDVDDDSDTESRSKPSIGALAGDIGILRSQKTNDNKLFLPSGKIITSQSKEQERSSSKRPIRSTVGKVTATGERSTEAIGGELSRTTSIPQPKRERAVAARGAMGLMGVSEQQKRSLVATEKKMQKQAAVIQQAEAWVTGRVANKQKHYRVSLPLR